MWGAFPSVKITYFETEVGTSCHISSVSSWQGRSRPGLLSPTSPKSRAQQQQTCTKRRHPGLTVLRSSGLCFGSQGTLQPNTPGSFWCSPGSPFSPTSRNQSAHSRAEPKLLSITAREDDQETPLKHSLWAKSPTWTYPDHHRTCCQIPPSLHQRHHI